MKIRIGKGSWQAWSGATALERQISKSLLSAVTGDIIELGNRQLRYIRDAVQDVATTEAHKLFTILTELIDQETAGASYAGFNSAALMMGITPDWEFLRNDQLGGEVQWAALSDHYYKFKRRHKRAHANQFFQFSGRLRAYFKNQGVSIVDSRLGGVQVNTIPKYVGDQLSTFPDAELGSRNTYEVLVGALTVRIFPSVAPSMLPGLASGRWMDTLADAGFERSVFSDLATEDKLANKDNPYRPLVAPAVQFWILTRIPQAIFRRLRTYFHKVGPSYE